MRLTEDVLVGTTPSPVRVFGFGSFPGATPDIDHPVTNAAANSQSLRIIFGKLLLGNYLQQIQCRAPVNMLPDGTLSAFDNVPVGATPDDIAKCCAAATDVLNASCGGALATCICHLPQGCNGIDMGKPVGIIDANQDGAADQMQFMPGAVGFQCKANGNTVNVPADLAQSYWNPSGFQQAPYTCAKPPCYDQVGPAIILVPTTPVGTKPLLPTNMDCGLTFSPDVVDHSNIQPCAAPTGRPPECADINLDKCTADQACTPGDVTAFSFHTEALTVTLNEFSDGAVGVSRTNDVHALTNVPVDPGSISTIQIRDVTNNAPYNAFTVTLNPANPSAITIHWTNATGLAAMTMYSITFPTTFTDYYHQGLPAPVTITFTTGA
ncbi:MAG: Ig-like domain-containing protein [Acidobacteriota bacterium]